MNFSSRDGFDLELYKKKNYTLNIFCILYETEFNRLGRYVLYGTLDNRAETKKHYFGYCHHPICE